MFAFFFLFTLFYATFIKLQFSDPGWIAEEFQEIYSLDRFLTKILNLRADQQVHLGSIEAFLSQLASEPPYNSYFNIKQLNFNHVPLSKLTCRFCLLIPVVI